MTTNFGGTYDWAYAGTRQPDDRILAAGVSNAHGTYDFALVRYTADRSLDPSFGGGGMVTTDFGDSYDWAYAQALQPDGRIVVGGVSDRGGSKNLALARYLPNGALDGSFGQNGLVAEGRRPLTTDIVRSLVLQPDGRILVAGVTFEDKVSIDPQGDFILARYLPDGSPDPTFGVGGVVTTDFGDGSYDDAYALVLQPDGRILLGGYSTSAGGPGVLFGADQLALARYTPAGLPDMGFGRGGKVVVDAGSLDEEIRALALTPAGAIVAAGFVNGERGGDTLVSRFTPDGSLDATFGEKGHAVTDLSPHSEGLTAVALQSDGRIVAAGDVARARDALADFAVVRFDPNGRLETSFGNGGVATADFAGRQDRVAALILQPDGKLVAVGSSEHDFA
ncbi:MAG: delta-60 repeat domain-containing protein, partial [Acidimicrobiia bacterium]